MSMDLNLNFEEESEEEEDVSVVDEDEEVRMVLDFSLIINFMCSVMVPCVMRPRARCNT